MSQSQIKLGNCTYTPYKGIILRPNGSQYKIAKKPADLLEILYKNPQQYFSLELLQETVWKGKTIQENTIHKCITRVREALGSTGDPSRCEFIENRRTEGYRFKATVAEIEVRDIETTDSTAMFKNYQGLLISACLSLLLSLIYFFYPTETLKPQIITTMLGQEIDATSGQKLLVFSHKSPNQSYWNLYAKPLGSERYFQLTNGEYDDRRSVFSPDNKRIAFQRHDGKSCKIIIADVNGVSIKLENENVVFKCLDQLLSVSISWKNNNNLYLSMTESLSSPYQVYLLDLKTGQTKVITHPPKGVQGDYYVSYSFEAEKLLYFRMIGSSHTEVWIYDPKTQHSDKLISMPLVLFSTAWINKSKEAILRSGNGQLSAININSGKLTSVLATDYPVSYPFRINSTSIGYVRGHLMVSDIIAINAKLEANTIISTSFHDYMPAYSQNTGAMAFISTRSGLAQIWLKPKELKARQLTHFKESHRVGGLAISNDGKAIAYTIKTQIHIIDNKGVNLFSSDDGVVYKNPTFSENGKKLYYSINHRGTWRIESRQLNNLNAPVNTVDGYIAKPCLDTLNCLYIIQYNNPKLYKFEKGKLTDTGVNLGDIQRPNQFELVDNSVYYVKKNQ